MNSIVCNFENKYFGNFNIEYTFNKENKTWSLTINDSLEMDNINSKEYEAAFRSFLSFIESEKKLHLFFENVLVFGGADFQLIKELILYSPPNDIESFNFGKITIVDPLVEILPKILSFNDCLLEYLVRCSGFIGILNKYNITYSDYKNNIYNNKTKKFDLIISDVSDSSSFDDISNEVYNFKYITFLYEIIENNGYLIIYCGAHDSNFKIKESDIIKCGFSILEIKDAGFGNMILAKKGDL